MKQWDKIFKKHGKVFLSIQEDIPMVAREFKKNGVKHVLDLGSGSGRHIVYLAKQGFDMYGFDISESGIKISKDWLKKEGFHARFKTGSIYKKLPYQDNFFDAVISTNTIHHEKVKNIRKTILEIKRILKPGGLIFITVRKRKLRKFYPKF
ncbi:MAG: class I SAM-dependent methyltransferase, partial [Parcubacteria group bacterium]|nr:class I SAM-dependent methyltransferase [Parcubacteria group bacterium]